MAPTFVGDSIHETDEDKGSEAMTGGSLLGGPGMTEMPGLQAALAAASAAMQAAGQSMPPPAPHMLQPDHTHSQACASLPQQRTSIAEGCFAFCQRLLHDGHLVLLVSSVITVPVRLYLVVPLAPYIASLYQVVSICHLVPDRDVYVDAACVLVCSRQLLWGANMVAWSCHTRGLMQVGGIQQV